MITYGIDVSKKTLAIFCSKTKVYCEINNEEKAIEKYFTKEILKITDDKQVIMEATSKYHFLASKILMNLGYRVIVVSPFMSRNFARALNICHKTDKVDAKMLCLFAEKIELRAINVENETISKLKELAQLYQVFTQDIATNKTRLENIADPMARSIIESLINEMKSRKQVLEDKMLFLISQNYHLQQKYVALTNMRSIGKATAIALLAFIPELGSPNLNRKQVAALCGLAPMNQDSGSFIGKRKIARGRFYPRQALYMAALSAITHNQPYKLFYKKLRDAGKAAKVAITACMRKLLITVNITLKQLTAS